MKKRWLRGFLVASVGLVLAISFSGSASGGLRPKPSQPVAKTKFDPKTILVKFRAPAESATKVQEAGDRPLGLIPGARVEVIKLQAGETVAGKLAEYRARSDVLFAEPNYILTPDALPPLTPNDPMLGSQWGLTNIQASEGWAIFPGTFAPSGGVKIAIIDTGVYAGHPDLAGKVAVADGAGCLGSGFICSNGYSSSDDMGHGTHVAGIAGAVADNGTGVAGLAVSSTLIPVKVCFGTVVGDGCPLASIASGIAWGAARGAKVLNLSLTGPSPGTLCAAAAAAIAKGVTVVAAAGNSSSRLASYPAACPGVIGVGADGNDNDSAFYGNWDYPNVFVSAPGGTTANNDFFDPFPPPPGDPTIEILSTVPFNLEDGSPSLYESIMGTSMASPFVAALAAMLKGEHPLRTPTDIRRVLAKTADKVLSPVFGDYGVPYGGYTVRGADPFRVCVTGECTWHPYWGYGQINARVALQGAPPKVLSFTPAVGVVGTPVTIAGEDLAGATEVSFGVPASPTVTGSGRTTTVLATPNENTIQVAVPDGALNGQITVKTPGGTSTSTGVFKVTPKVTSFDPASARRLLDPVTVHGKSFTGATSVKVGVVAATAYTVVDDETITFTVPATATTGKVTVTTPTGTATSVASLLVILPPTVTSFAPASGPVGSLVTVSGTSLDSVTSATLGGVDVGLITHVSATQLRFNVPEAVPGNQGKIVVHNDAGDSPASVGVFKVTPKVTGFAPATTTRGENVVVQGESFTGATVVKIGAVTAPIVVPPAVVGDEQLTIQVPPTAITGKISVTTPSGTGVSADNLVVILPPTVTSFAPASGPVGTLVTVNGTNLDSVTSGTLNGAAVGPITHPTATSVRFAVPAAAGPSGKITLTNPAGTATSAASFTIPFLVTGFAPTAGAGGTIVTINGSGLSTVTLVEFNGAPALPITVGPTSVTAAVPPSATTGPIRLTTATGQSAVSPDSFNISSISGFTPMIGAAGTTVAITGEGFEAVTSVDFNGAPASFTKDSSTQITATVPAAATDGPIRLHVSPSGTATTANNFSVVKITGFNPSSARVGTVVTINGTHLSGAGGVLFNGVAAASFDVNGAGTEVTAPVPAAGQTGPITVTTPNGNAVSAGNFAVTPAITEFAPHAGAPGAEITIRGSGLVQVNNVYFQGHPAASFTVDSPTQVRAIVPSVSSLTDLNGPIALATAGGTTVTDFFDQGFFSGGATAHLVLNEVNRNLVELRATSGGFLSGLKLVMNPNGAPVRLGGLQGTVAAGDLIVVHAGVTSNGSPVFDEIPGLMPKSTCSHVDCFANAWDFGASPLTFGNIVLTVQDGFLIQDAMALSRTGSAEAGFPAELQALQTQNAWSPASCGGAPCTYASNPTASGISVDWSAAGVFSGGTSLARTGASDTDARADWMAGTPSFGA